MNRLLGTLSIAVLVAACSGPPAPSVTSASVRPTALPAEGPSSEPLPAVDILDAGRVDTQHGWALTAADLLLTDDAGSTWRATAIPGPPTARGVLGVLFADANHGWLATLDSNDPTSALFDIWRTTDGAATWSRARVPEGANRSDTMGPADFATLPGGHVFAFIEGGMPDGYTGDLYASNDGGVSWGPARVTPDSGVTGPIAFADPDHAIVAGGAPGNRMFSTQDGGRTWRRAAIPTLPGTVADDMQLWAPARFWDERSGAVAVLYATPDAATELGMLVTADAGATWSLAAAFPLLPGSSNAVPVASLDPSHWMAQMGPSTVASTDDGGRTWSTIASSGLPATPDSLLMADREHGWALVEQNACLTFKSNCVSRTSLFATSDSGVTWTAVSPAAAP